MGGGICRIPSKLLFVKYLYGSPINSAKNNNLIVKAYAKLY